ncbi:MAG: hypothetical protein CVU38_07875 [Chloroflexi bacterium HGW-Chloroflexi-1]|nr:MAG: hypothetical protein CVU38_07875 [Chloroflexi bacterium HGW-Chloroflexi-1]
MDTVLESYETRLKPLPIVERLQLAQLLMSDLVKSAPRWTIDVSYEWSDEDLMDFTRATFAHAAQSFGEEEDDV